MELHLKIWAFGIRRRILTIKPCPGALGVWIRARRIAFRPCAVGARVTQQPALLHVNFESRQVALQHYKLAFKPLLGNYPVFFNDKLDGLYIKDDCGLSNSFWRALCVDKKIRSCSEKNLRVLVVRNKSSWHLAQIMKQVLGLKEVFCLDPIFKVSELLVSGAKSFEGFEAQFRGEWDRVKGNDKRQLVVKFQSKESLQVMIKVMEAS
jgi:hypothetical protein